MEELLLLNAIVPFIMVLVGGMLKIFPVSDMTSQNGYSTPVSRKSQKHWDYAQKIAPGTFISTGVWLFIAEIVISIVSLMFEFSVVGSVIVGTCVGFAALFGAFFYTDLKIEEFMEGQR